MIFAILMNKNVELADQSVIKLSIVNRIKFNLVCIKEGLKIRELWRTLLFFLLTAIIVPSFGDYLYYYQLYVSKFSQLEYAMITLLGFVGTLVSSVSYNWLLKNYEERSLLALAMAVNCLGSVATLLYVLDITFGMKPLVFVCLTSTVTDTISKTLSNLPCMVLFSKIIPSRIEASMFALMMGLLNLTNLVISKLLGNFYNKFIGVSKDNLQDIWKLMVISSVLSVVPIFLIWMLPKKAEVSAVQRVIDYAEKKTLGKGSECDLDKIDPAVAERLGVIIEYPSPQSSNLNGFEEFEVKEVS